MIRKTINKGRVPIFIWTEDIESSAIEQLVNISALPFIHDHVAVMPDVHAGIGATVGSVIPTRKAIIPAAVGVDIGCGMMAVQLTLKAHELPVNLRGVREAIEKVVPVGFKGHPRNAIRTGPVKALESRYEALMERHPDLFKMQRDRQGWARQMGSLGSGNHFIELCLDEVGGVWIMLHSGSRGIGNQIGRYFIERAKQDMLHHDVHLPDKDLAYFEEGNSHFHEYVEAVNWAQDYAAANRQEMMALVVGALRQTLPPFRTSVEAVNCHHNYVSQETHYGEAVYVTRKGAIRAGVGERGIIPGSMGTKSYIVRGRGNPESFCSCSHGAGRRMSRTKAKKKFSLTDLAEQTAGVECRKDAGVVDEAPGAYKDIDQVMANQSDLVDVEYTLKQVLCVKG